MLREAKSFAMKTGMHPSVLFNSETKYTLLLLTCSLKGNKRGGGEEGDKLCRACKSKVCKPVKPGLSTCFAILQTQ